MKKTSILKRFTYCFMALAIALFGVLFCGTQNGITANNNAQASAKTIISTTNGNTNIRFEPFDVMSSLKIPSSWGGIGAVIPMQYSLTVFCEPSVNEDGTDHTRFTLALNGTYGYYAQGKNSYNYTNKLFLDKSLSDGFDKSYVDQFLDTENYGYYELPNNGIEMYGWKSVYGFAPSNVFSQLYFNYLPDFATIGEVWNHYDETVNLQSQFAVPFIYYLCTTNVNDTGFDWSRVNYLRHTITSPRGMSYEIGEVDGQDVYQSVRFNSYDIYDFCKTEDVFFRFVFPSYNNNLPFTQEYVYFENLGYEIGYDYGYQSGLNENNKNAYDNGYRDGYQLGESVGYENGINRQENGFFNLMSAVVNAPVSVFTGLLDVNILGVNLSQFAISLLSIALIVAVLRFIL